MFQYHGGVAIEHMPLSLEGSQTSTSQLLFSESLTQTHITRQSARDSLLSQPTFAPYTDDPEQGPAEPPEPATLLQVQRSLMDGENPLSVHELYLNTDLKNKISDLMNFRTP